MKFLYFLIVVLIFASGYLSYREGYLADLHPLLDPAATIVVTREDGDSDIDIDEEDAVVAKASRSGGEKAPYPTEGASSAEPQVSEKELARMEKAERDRLAKEARDAERAAAAAEREAGIAARKAHNENIEREIAGLNLRLSEIQSQLRGSQAKLHEQEVAWRQERIKTREADKEQLRSAARAYQTQLNSQIDQVYQQIRDKRRELK